MTALVDLSRFGGASGTRRGLLLLLTFLLLAQFARANPPAEGIRFFTGTWAELLTEAQKQNKPIFVDVYATWCRPCQELARDVFTDSTVGAKVNAHFISYQLDAEKGEGPRLAKQFTIIGYPTMLFLRPDGKVVHRVFGDMDLDIFLQTIDLATEALNNPQTLSDWDDAFAGGERSLDFLTTYLELRTYYRTPHPQALEAYLNATPQPDWVSPDNLKLIRAHLTTAQTSLFRPLVQLTAALQRDLSQFDTVDLLQQTLDKALEQDGLAATTEAAMQQAITTRLFMADQLMPELVTPAWRAETSAQLWIDYYVRTQNRAKFRVHAQALGKRLMAVSATELARQDKLTYAAFLQQASGQPASVRQSDSFRREEATMQKAETWAHAQRLSLLAWDTYEIGTTPADLQLALSWSARAVALDRSPDFLDTHAKILHKLGRKTEAISCALEALNRAKAKGDDVADYEKLLAELRQ